MSDTIAQPGLDSLSKSFEPASIEAQWGPEWEKRGYGAAGVRGTGQADASQPSFSVQLPPPNVTGTLHMGHAFNQTIMDSLTRYHRMKRPQHGLGPGHRPRRHRHPDRGGTPAAGAGHQPPRHGPDARRGAQELRRQGLGMEGESERQHHHHADAPHGRQRGLEPRVLHHGRQALVRRDRDLCAPVPARPDLPWQAPGELGPGADVRRESDLEVESEEEDGSLWHIAYPLADGSGHSSA